MDFSSAGLFLSLLIGAVGAGLLMFGRKQRRWPQLAGGVILCVYPYFCPNLWLMAGIGIAVIVLVWVLVRAGY